MDGGAVAGKDFVELAGTGGVAFAFEENFEVGIVNFEVGSLGVIIGGSI